MAACGLEASRRDSMRSPENDENISDNVVKVMAQFAVEMIAVLDKLKMRTFYTSKPYRYIFTLHELLSYLLIYYKILF